MCINKQNVTAKEKGRRQASFFEFVHEAVSDRFACIGENIGILGVFEDFGSYFLHIFENRVASDLILEHLHVLEILDAVADIFKSYRTDGSLFLLTEELAVIDKDSAAIRLQPNKEVRQR